MRVFLWVSFSVPTVELSHPTPVIRGDSLDLICSWSWPITLDKEVTWYRQLPGEKQQQIWRDLSDDNEKFSHKEVDESGKEARISMKNVTDEDIGDYSCHLRLNLFSDDTDFVYYSSRKSIDNLIGIGLISFYFHFILIFIIRVT